MDLREFYKLLAATKSDPWTMGIYGHIRMESTESYCPLTRVCQTVTKRTYKIYQYTHAGQALGLSYRQCEKLVKAADLAIGYSPSVRTQLEKALFTQEIVK